MASIVVPTAGLMFDPNNPKYRCCCGSCHVKTGTLIIGILHAIGLGFQALSLLGQLAAGNGLGIVSPLITLAVGVPVLVFLFLGLKHERPGYLIPYLVFQAIEIALFCIGIFVLIILMAVGSVMLKEWLDKEVKEQQAATGGDQFEINEQALSTAVIVYCVLMIVVCLLGVGLSIWFFLIVLNCYRYFNEKAFGDGAAVPGQVAVAYSGYPAYHGQPQVYQPPQEVKK